MLRVLFIAFCASVVWCIESEISVKDEKMTNGEENEIVSIDLKRHDGNRLIAQLRIHLNKNKVHVNGHPLKHEVVNHVNMRVSIMEYKEDIRMELHLAPSKFRILITEKPGLNGNKILTAELEFTEVERFAVVQVDVKQIIWEGTKRRPLTSISLQESTIHNRPNKFDHHVLYPDEEFKPRLPTGLIGGNDYYEVSESKIICWFNQLSLGGKIAILCSATLTFLVSLLTLITCWKRHFHQRNFNVQIPIDDLVEVIDNETDKKKTTIRCDNEEFHLEMDNVEIDIDDKKPLVG